MGVCVTMPHAPGSAGRIPHTTVRQRATVVVKSIQARNPDAVFKGAVLSLILLLLLDL